MNRSVNPLVAATLLLIALASAILAYWGFNTGDDLNFQIALGLDNYRITDRSTLSFFIAHTLTVNGRLFDWLGPVIVNALPRTLAATLLGSMTMLYFYSIILSARISCGRYTTLTMTLIAVTLIATPWWDNLWMPVCQFNYIWGATFCLLFLNALYHQYNATTSSLKSGLRLFALLLLGFCAGASHEQFGLSLCATLFGLIIIMRLLKRPLHLPITLERRMLLLGLALGTILTFASPNLYHRAATATLHYPALRLILITFPLYIAAIVIYAVAACTHIGRRAIRRLLPTVWTPMLIIALLTAIIAAASGVPGRTGILAEGIAIAGVVQFAFALKDVRGDAGATGGIDADPDEYNVATVDDACRQKKRQLPLWLAAPLSIIIFTLIALHYVAAIEWQHKVYDENQRLIAAYRRSADGIVSLDYTGRYDVPPYLLGRIKGLPDADDHWERLIFARAYGSEAKPLTILPAAMRGQFPRGNQMIAAPRNSAGVNSAGVSGFSDFTVVSRIAPADTIRNYDGLLISGFFSDTPRVVTRRDSLWIAEPYILDAGYCTRPAQPHLGGNKIYCNMPVNSGI